MPRYFFHVHDGQDIPDKDGTELADVQVAKVEATTMLGSLLAQQPWHIWNDHGLWLEVADDTGLTLFAVHVTTVLDPAPDPAPDPDTAPGATRPDI